MWHLPVKNFLLFFLELRDLSYRFANRQPEGLLRRMRGRQEKRRILDEGCNLLGLHRKSLIRVFGRSGRRPSGRRRGRKVKYEAELLGPLKVIWLGSNQPCGKRLKVVVSLWVASYEKHHGVLVPDVRVASGDESFDAGPACCGRFGHGVGGCAGRNASDVWRGKFPFGRTSGAWTCRATLRPTRWLTGAARRSARSSGA